MCIKSTELTFNSKYGSASDSASGSVSRAKAGIVGVVRYTIQLTARPRGHVKYQSGLHRFEVVGPRVRRQHYVGDSVTGVCAELNQWPSVFGPIDGAQR